MNQPARTTCTRALGELELTVPTEPLALSLCFQCPSVLTIRGAAISSTVARRLATRPAGEGLPLAPRILCTARGSCGAASAHRAARTPFYVQE